MDVVLPFALILVAFYFLILRPQRARARQAGQLQARLEPGVEIMTTSGIYGRVTEIREDSLLLEVAPGTIIRVAKAALGKVLVDDSGDPADGTLAPDVDLTEDADVETGRRGSAGE
ncbi:MAG: preprotein translocase subunit YajC [Sporichthyaceae bacterium]